MPVLFVVMSNGAYRTVQDTYGAMGGQGVCPGTELGQLDFTRAQSATHLRQLVVEAHALTRPLLVDVPLRAS